MKIDLHMKRLAPRLASKKRPEVIRKWSINYQIDGFDSWRLYENEIQVKVFLSRRFASRVRCFLSALSYGEKSRKSSGTSVVIATQGKKF